ncbi:MAG: metal-dependent transcriptional regulator [Clostridia bacterium]|nr:metal-dependent transcriptional regulator [Clostridia bacterium]
MKIQESAENYLETIYVLKKRKSSVRSIDIANELGFSKPSVSVAMKNLRENGYIETDKDGYITLLPMGENVAKRVFERHTILTKCLLKLGVSETTADEDACKIEHIISNETIEALKRFIEN